MVKNFISLTGCVLHSIHIQETSGLFSSLFGKSKTTTEDKITELEKELSTISGQALAIAHRVDGWKGDDEEGKTGLIDDPKSDPKSEVKGSKNKNTNKNDPEDRFFLNKARSEFKNTVEFSKQPERFFLNSRSTVVYSGRVLKTPEDLPSNLKPFPGESKLKQFYRESYIWKGKLEAVKEKAEQLPDFYVEREGLMKKIEATYEDMEYLDEYIRLTRHVNDAIFGSVSVEKQQGNPKGKKGKGWSLWPSGLLSFARKNTENKDDTVEESEEANTKSLQEQLGEMDQEFKDFRKDFKKKTSTTQTPDSSIELQSYLKKFKDFEPTKLMDADLQQHLEEFHEYKEEYGLKLQEKRLMGKRQELLEHVQKEIVPEIEGMMRGEVDDDETNVGSDESNDEANDGKSEDGEDKSLEAKDKSLEDKSLAGVVGSQNETIVSGSGTPTSNESKEVGGNKHDVKDDKNVDHTEDSGATKPKGSSESEIGTVADDKDEKKDSGSKITKPDDKENNPDKSKSDKISNPDKKDNSPVAGNPEPEIEPEVNPGASTIPRPIPAIDGAYAPVNKGKKEGISLRFSVGL